MKVDITLYICAPIDLVWELLAEGTTSEHCPVTGIKSHEITEEHSDGITQRVTFNDRDLIKRVYVDDAKRELLIKYFSNEEQEGIIQNRLSGIAQATQMHFSLEWHAQDTTSETHEELQTTYRKRLKDFKSYAENIWGAEAVDSFTPQPDISGTEQIHRNIN